MTPKKETSFQKTTAKILPDVLYDFSMAVMGNRCRTRPILRFDGLQSTTYEWLEAHQTRQGSWSLFSRSKTIARENEQDLDALNNSFEQLEIKPEDGAQSFGLIDILTIMTQFEKGNADDVQNALLLEDFAGHDLEALGQQHYIAFGIRECIAFDQKTGLPAPSFEGRIVGGGFFTEEMENDIEAAWAAKVEKFGKDGSYLDILRLNGQTSTANSLNDLFRGLNKQKSYTEIIDYFEANIFSIFKLCDERGFDHNVVIEQDGKPNRLEHAGIALETIIQQTLDDKTIETSYADTLSDAEIDNIIKILISLDIFRAILRARWAIEQATQNPELADQSETFTKQSIAKIQQRYKDHDLEAIDEDLLTNAIFDKTSAQAMTIDKTIEKIRQDLKALNDEQRQSTRALQDSGNTALPSTSILSIKRG